MDTTVLKCRAAVCWLGFAAMGWQGLPHATAKAGLLIEPWIGWSSFAFRPKDEEPTPNYRAYATGINVGYSAAQRFDFGLGGTYHPAKLNAATPLQEKAALYSYGGTIAYRPAGRAYIGIRGGTYVYNSLYRVDEANEIDGRWSGPGGAISLGALLPINRENFWLLSFDFESATVEQIEPESTVPEKRKIEVFMVRLAYVFNAREGVGLLDTYFEGFF